MIDVIGTSSTMKLLQPEKRIEQHRQSPIKVPDNLKFRGSESQGREEPENPLQSQKKTRDLPNLNKCHACGFIVDVCAGKKRLHILNSEWRIVLLCKNCLSSIKSSRMCSYCFSESSADCFCCEQCKHSVHKKCFSKYKDTAPWSYACSGSEFSVCVDCWVPKSVVISRKRMKTGKVKKKDRIVLEKDASRFSDDGNSAVSLEDVVKDANLVVDEKVEAAARARDEAVKKAVVARRAVEAANSALSLVPRGDENSLNERLKMGADKVVELYPPVSSSPSSCCLFNSSYLDTAKAGTSSSDSPCMRSNPSNSSDFLKHEVSSDNNMHKDSHKYVMKPSVCMDGSDKRTSSNEGKCMVDCDSKEEIGEELMKEGEGSCSDRQISGYYILNLDRKQTETALPGEERCNGQPDRYFLKYRRRVCRLKPISDSKPKILHSNNDTNLESQGSATEVPLSCSWELRTLSNG
ncbi:uncharacterized protein LOC114712806 [Neltuma alba]|uniref:uncharacterized protein LOC114712806 n=1 Tax=Neltuma alba TaxID=207710 RepID=UPI0010A41861|nr:uncharacterized protein LOC114712806 [Prosopis alba]